MEFIKRGSFTVEAAFILPVVLLIIFGLLSCGLWLQEEIVSELEELRILEKKEMELKHIGDIETGRPDYDKILYRPEGTGKEEVPVFYPAEYKRRMDRWQR